MQSADWIPPTTDRVVRHTDQESNAGIQRQTEANVAYYASHDRRLLDIRLQELDREWDIERILEANAAMVSLIGLSLGRFHNRRWFLLPTAVADFCCNMPSRAGVSRWPSSVDWACGHNARSMRSGMR